MKVELIFDDFNAPFSDLIDKERFEVFKVPEVQNGWVVKPIKKSQIITKDEKPT